MNEKNQDDEALPEAESVVDEAFKDADFEEKVAHYWGKYQKQIFMAIGVILVGFIGMHGMSFYKDRQVEKLQDELRDAQENGAELEFAARNVKEPLAGTVFIKEADKFFAQEDFDQAIQYYQKSLKPLANTPLGTRARLGIAMSNVLAGNHDTGVSQLEKLMNDRKVLGTFRAEAAYNLALIAYQSKEYVDSKVFIDAIPNIPDAGIWATKAILLKRTSHELAD